jgi:hypothetical protein
MGDESEIAELRRRISVLEQDAEGRADRFSAHLAEGE